MSARTGPSGASVKRWTRRLLAVSGAAAHFSAAGVSVLLCGDSRMRALSLAHLGEDRTTDVLSFPAGESGFLGDIALDVPYASRQARRRGHALERELKVLLAHGLLHLLGYDHETDDGKMFRRQREIVRAAFGAGPDGVPEREAAQVPARRNRL